MQKTGPTVTKVVTVVTTKKAAVETEKKKGELMENDQDAMEVMEVSCISIVKEIINIPFIRGMRMRIVLGFFHLLQARNFLI